jgi:hypothetical protein
MNEAVSIDEKEDWFFRKSFEIKPEYLPTQSYSLKLAAREGLSFSILKCLLPEHKKSVRKSSLIFEKTIKQQNTC